MKELDQIDRQLVALLKHDGRASVTNLAARLGLSRVTVQSRMNRLVKSGVIHRYTVELGTPTRDDLVHAVTMIELTGALNETVKRQLKKMPEITSIHTTNGKWGLVVQTESQNLAAFDNLLGDIGKIKGVLQAETCLLLSKVL